MCFSILLSCKHRIPVKVSEETNCDEIARELIDKHKHLSSKQASRVEFLIRQLQQQQPPPSSPPLADTSSTQRLPSRGMSAVSQLKGKRASSSGRPSTSSSKKSFTAAAAPAASLDNLHKYMKQLYENDDEKRKSTSAIAELGRDPQNLPHLMVCSSAAELTFSHFACASLRLLQILARCLQLHFVFAQENTTLLRALARTLRDDFKKNQVVVYNIILIFFAVSNFSNLHPFLVDNQVGDAVMKVIEYEEERSKEWEKCVVA
jgi:hypothetical protein